MTDTENVQILNNYINNCSYAGLNKDTVLVYSILQAMQAKLEETKDEPKKGK